MQRKKVIAIILIIVSYLVYGVIFIVPFLAIGLKEKGVIIASLYILSYLIFGFGGVLLGKELLQKYNPLKWLKRKS